MYNRQGKSGDNEFPKGSMLHVDASITTCVQARH